MKRNYEREGEAPEFDMKKVTTPLLLHLLGEELQFPKLFPMRVSLLNITNCPKIRKRQKNDSLSHLLMFQILSDSHDQH